MSLAGHMHVSLRLPTRLLHEGAALKLFAVAENGAFGMLPNHADHVSSLVPSVLVLTDADGKEHFFGIDHGLLVKHGHQVDIAVRPPRRRRRGRRGRRPPERTGVRRSVRRRPVRPSGRC